MDAVTAERVPTPTALGKAGRAFWRSVHALYSDLSPSELLLLEQACRQVDVIAALDAAAAAEPLTTGSKGQTIVNPAATEARLGRQQVARILDQLGLPAPDSAATEATPSSPAKRRARKAAEARWSRPGARRAEGA